MQAASILCMMSQRRRSLILPLFIVTLAGCPTHTFPKSVLSVPSVAEVWVVITFGDHFYTLYTPFLYIHTLFRVDTLDEHIFMAVIPLSALCTLYCDHETLEPHICIPWSSLFQICMHFFQICLHKFLHMLRTKCTCLISA